MRELEKIKEEKAAALAKKEREERELAEQLNKESALKSNPLVNLSTSQEDLSAKVCAPHSHFHTPNSSSSSCGSTGKAAME